MGRQAGPAALAQAGRMASKPAHAGVGGSAHTDPAASLARTSGQAAQARRLVRPSKAGPDSEAAQRGMEAAHIAKTSLCF